MRDRCLNSCLDNILWRQLAHGCGKHRAHGNLGTAAIGPIAFHEIDGERRTYGPDTVWTGQHAPNREIRRSRVGICIPTIVFQQCPKLIGHSEGIIGILEFIDEPCPDQIA